MNINQTAEWVERRYIAVIKNLKTALAKLDGMDESAKVDFEGESNRIATLAAYSLMLSRESKMRGDAASMTRAMSAMTRSESRANTLHHTILGMVAVARSEAEEVPELARPMENWRRDYAEGECQ